MSFQTGVTTRIELIFFTLALTNYHINTALPIYQYEWGMCLLVLGHIGVGEFRPNWTTSVLLSKIEFSRFGPRQDRSSQCAKSIILHEKLVRY